MSDLNSEEFLYFHEWEARRNRRRSEDSSDELSSDDYSSISGHSHEVDRRTDPNFTGPRRPRRRSHRRRSYHHSRSRSSSPGNRHSRRHSTSRHNSRSRSRSRSRSGSRTRSGSRSRSVDKRDHRFSQAEHIVSVVDVSPRMLSLDKFGELSVKACEDWVDIMRQVLKQNHKIRLHDWIAPTARTYIDLRFRQAWPQMATKGDDWSKWSAETVFSHMLKIWNRHSKAHIELSLEAYYRSIVPRVKFQGQGQNNLDAWNAWAAKA